MKQPNPKNPRVGKRSASDPAVRRMAHPRSEGTKIKFLFSAGGIVYRKTAKDFEILLIKYPNGKWALPKGKYEPGEKGPATALREIQEETGLNNLKIRNKLKPNRFFFQLEGRLVMKTVALFLVEATGKTKIKKQLLDPDEHGVLDAKWYTPEEALTAAGYKDLRTNLREAIDKLKKH